VTASKPVSYYLALLKSTQTQPYVQLAWELQGLPDLTNATAVAKITYLALNATNPEVKEAFQLMMKGGTPDPRDYTYTVPDYNTELQVLYWLALQNEFKKDDTLALAIAMVNGFWVTIGDNQVRWSVRKDANDLLGFLRETNELQSARGYYQLENYPLEAKVCLAWTGGDPNRGGHMTTQRGGNVRRPLNIHALTEYSSRPIDLTGYEWNTVSVDTLRRARQLVEERAWIDRSVDKTVNSLEEYFYLSSRPAWNFTWPENQGFVRVNGETTLNRNFNNADFEFEHFILYGKAIGVCGDEAVLIDALSKSWGISTTIVTRTWQGPDGNNHMHVAYYEPVSRVWKALEKQVSTFDSRERGKGAQNLYIFKPPVVHCNFFDGQQDDKQRLLMLRFYYSMKNVATEDVIQIFTHGMSNSQMKQWLLYS